MDWKEQFGREFGSYEALYESRHPDGWILSDYIKKFIETEIIEKLIEEIPNKDVVAGSYDHETGETTVILDWLKQQLRAKWLNK